MLRQVKISLATLLGLLAGALLLVVSEFTKQRAYPVDPFTGEQFTLFTWVKGVIMLDMPIAGIVLLMSLALLEWVQPRLKAPRLLTFVFGAMAIAGIAGGVFSFAAAAFFAFDPSLFEHAFGFETPTMMVTDLFIIPALTASLAYVWLTKDMAPGAADPLPQEPYAVEVPAPVLPTLQAAPDARRMAAIMTSPDHRIGQRAFLYAIRLWSIAASIWLIAPILIAGFLGMDENEKYIIAGVGWAALYWSAFCITANRAHDLGLSAAWAGVPIFAAIAWVMLETPADKPLISITAATHCVIALLLCYMLTAALLIIRRGDPSPDRYGAASI